MSRVTTARVSGRPLRIGCASGFWGDSPFASAQLVHGNTGEAALDYLVSDYLAEVTMCLLAASQRRAVAAAEAKAQAAGADVAAAVAAARGETGFIGEFVDTVWKPLMAPLMKAGTRVVTNAGGLNPIALARAVAAASAAAVQRAAKAKAKAEATTPGGGTAAAAAAAGGSEVLRLPTIVAVTGDDLTVVAPQLRADGACLPFAPVRATADEALWDDSEGAPAPMTMNAYLGARPIAAALALGADVVITGRVVDSAVVLGPLLHEFGWGEADYDLLSAGSLAGHLIECGCHVTGGNYTDWEESRDAAGWTNVGYPIAEVEADGTFVVTKTPGTGGVVNVKSVTEQLLYEIHDPSSYYLPDVVCDWRNVTATVVGEDRVRVVGARGRPAPLTYKCAITQWAGYKLGAMLVLSGREAPAKLTAVGEALVARVEGLLAVRRIEPAAFDDVRIEVVGSEGPSFGDNASEAAQHAREAILRVVVAHSNPKALGLFGRELAPVALAMAPGLVGGGEGRPRPQPRIRYFSCLLDKSRVPVQLTVMRPDKAGPSAHTFAADETISYGTESLPARAGKAEAEAEAAAEADATTESSAAAAAAAAPLPDELVMAPLIALCYGRSGDKGDVCNVGVAVRDPAHYGWLCRALSAEAVRAFMAHHLDGEGGADVVRYELPGVHGLNFVLTRALGQGGIASMRLDRQGKGYAQTLLELRVPMPRAWVPPKYTNEISVADPRARL